MQIKIYLLVGEVHSDEFRCEHFQRSNRFQTDVNSHCEFNVAIYVASAVQHRSLNVLTHHLFHI